LHATSVIVGLLSRSDARSRASSSGDLDAAVVFGQHLLRRVVVALFSGNSGAAILHPTLTLCQFSSGCSASVLIEKETAGAPLHPTFRFAGLQRDRYLTCNQALTGYTILHFSSGAISAGC
jgi:hypothetical protein